LCQNTYLILSMDVLKESPNKTNNPSFTSINVSQIEENLQKLHQALSEDQSDEFIVDELISGLKPYFDKANGLFLFEKIHGEVRLTAKNIVELQSSVVPSLSLEELEHCGNDCNRDIGVFEISNNDLYKELSGFLARAHLQDCLLLPIKIHDNVVAVLLVVGVMPNSISEVPKEYIEASRVLLTNLVLMLQKRNRAKVQAQLQAHLLGFTGIDDTLSKFSNLLLRHEDSIFQIQILSLDEDYVYDFHVYGQMLEFEEKIKENILSKGNVHIGFNKTLEQAVKTKSSIYTADVQLDANWNAPSYSKTRSIIYFPLCNADNQVVGVFCAISNKVNGFSQSDQRFLQEAMGAVNLVFQSHYRISSLEEKNLQLSQLADFSQTLQDTNSKNEAQLKSFQVVMEETPATSFYFIEYSKKEDCFIIKARASRSGFSLALEKPILQDKASLTEYVDITTNLPIHLVGEPVSMLKQTVVALELEDDTSEVIIYPLVFEDSKTIEFAMMTTDKCFSSADLLLTKTIFSGYGNFIGRIESVVQAQHEAAAYKRLSSFGSKIEELKNFEDLIDYGVQQLMEIFAVKDARHYVCTEERKVFTSVKNWGTELFENTVFRNNDSFFLNTVSKTGEIIYVKDYVHHEKRIPKLVEKGLKSVIFLPIVFNDKVEHIIAFHGNNERIKLSEADLDLARQFLARLGNALEHKEYIDQLERTREDTLRSLGIVLEQRDFETRGHTDRVVTLSRNFAKQINLSSEQIQELIFGAYLHDIGKLAIPDRILLKPGKLTNEEFSEIKTHAVRGYDMANKIPLLSEASSLLVRHHHEQWQGSGYPDKLEGEEIPFLARMFTLVDVYDALRSHRPYKKAWTKDECFLELRDKSGIMFDPSLVEDFIVVADDYDAAYKEHNSQQENSDLFTKKQELMLG